MAENEPKTFNDLWLMIETSQGWFDGQIRFEDVRNGADPEVGMVADMSWNVHVSPNRVKILKKTYVISDVKTGGSFSCRVDIEIVAEYVSMEEFRDSEWWDLAMERFSWGDTDASWLRTVDLDGEEMDVDPTWIEYGPSVTVSMEVGKQYRDWLGNTRQDRGHGILDVRVERMSGDLWLRHDGHVVEGTVREIEAAMMLAERLKSLGVEIGDESITIPLKKGDDEQ